jgi:transposase-like protein
MKLRDIYKKFPTQNDCLSCLEEIRWASIPVCPTCGLTKFSPLKEKHKYHCNLCNRTFTVTAKTIFHKTKIDLQKWFYAIDVTINPALDLSARELAEQIEVTKDTAWAMQKKIKSNLTTSPQILFSIDNKINN